MYSFRKKTLILFICLALIGVLVGCGQDNSSEPPQAPNTGNPPVGNTGDDAPKPPEDNQEQLLQEIISLAKQGKVVGCDYVAGKTVFDQVEQDWDKADKTDYVAAAKGTYATYTSRGFVFGINKGYQVFEIRAMAKGNELEKIRASYVKEVLGAPDKVLDYPGQDIFGYTAGTEYKLEFVFPEPSEDEEDPVLDHVNVLYPKGTVNMMADDPGREW